MKMQIGLLQSSRAADIEALFRTHYPQVTCQVLNSHLTVGEVDAVLAGGGPDLTPGLYGQENRASRQVNPERDARELDTIKAVLAADVPFLGLCRGAQLLNVALGGTLWQDLETERGCAHPEMHSVKFSGAGARHLGEQALVNSTHHQGIDRVGSGLEVIATADDGLPEAWYRPGAIGVQFHPETLIKDDLGWLRLFDWWLAGAA
ncbi:gamma-glutamyl-gamma-aminobutyrate hydrolase family protein [Deinococcus marmoris]|uniref:gamma-glutamyl-gamma-aminobutyrate hydrolase family protein n=1 Tax=Deinococcus marmoris TaxID=249408 RepID=UPI000AFBE753|nr:gamma-glutamyl-gamma-aminobutyrate hydrolase family protein [Deinococcus marmoris]